MSNLFYYHNKSNFIVISCPNFKSKETKLLEDSRRSGADIYKLLKENKIDEINVKTYFNLPSLFDLIKNADLSIGAGGTSSIERLYMKLDSFVISVASNQKKICQRLHSNKFIYYLGHVGKINPKRLTLALSMYVNNKIYFEDPHFIVDNKGIDRIYSLFAGAKSPFIIRKANFEDIYILWNWRNDKNVREQIENWFVLELVNGVIIKEKVK